ncbi:MAG: hypothetical protein AAFZ52_08870 [Bacteroidota bacterium]
MRYVYTIGLAVALACSLSAESFRGFLLTKDNYQLTGYFNLIEYSPTGNFIVFTNDFGDVYDIHPMLVKGFGFSTEGTNFRYVSRFHEGQWFFLREEMAGRALRLYRLPDGNDRWVDDRVLRLFSTQPPRFYIGYDGGKKLLAVPRAGFKRNLRDFFAEASPELASKIGKKGYRYKDIYAIVGEFNELSGRARRRL